MIAAVTLAGTFAYLAAFPAGRVVASGFALLAAAGLTVIAT